MKRVFAILLVLAMVLSLSIPALAAEETGSITITNATIDETYSVYKVFDATVKYKEENGQTVADGVSYTIDKDNNQFFEVLFGADGTLDNTYFSYNPNTGSVTKKEGVDDSKLIEYLTNLVKEGHSFAAAKTAIAASEEVKFENLSYGYYLITSSLGATVTINSNTPDVEVIDKNQEPGSGFNKQVWDEDKQEWAYANSANIGDKISYQISFEATNYDGINKIKHYQIHDEKGDAIWAEFNSFTVKVGGVELKRGYYLAQGGTNTNNWKFLGDWSEIPEAERDVNDAQWYLVHLGEDQFRITIPWLEGHELSSNVGDDGKTTYTLTYATNAASKYDSPSQVEITYDAVIEANAAIGDTTHGNRFNKAYASWTSEHETGSTPPDEVVTNVYGIGLLKDDGATSQNLAGAKFRVYSDAECTEEVWVIPTDVDGVYIVDSLYKPITNASGTGKQVSRDIFAAYLADYLGEKTQDNYVVSQVNGKLAILGLEAGTYYLKEVEAPDGYNALTTPVELKAGENTRPFIIFADSEGNVADIQDATGGYTEHRLDLTHTVVHNYKGAVLPSTGGKGTIMLITFGTLVAMGFAILLITQKKMSVYKG